MIHTLTKPEWWAEKPTVYWIYGPTGTGKTKWASENFKDIYWKDETKWWDGYDRHKTIFIDDFRASHMKFNCLLRLLDRYPFRCEIKGGYRWITSKNTIITKNRRPSDMYQLPDEDMQQLNRRIDKIIRFDNTGNMISQSQKSGNIIWTSFNIISF